jgi:HlyD family secretion protein
MASIGSHRTNDRLAVLFEGATPSERQARWWQRTSGRVAVAVVAALVLTVAVAAQAFGSAGNEYRTATVMQRDVDAILSGAATVEPVSQATVAFPVSGTVESVGVKVGDAVTVGQTLATLDPATLTEMLHERQAAFAQAQLDLDNALSGKQVSAAPSGASGTGVAGTSGVSTESGQATVSLLSTTGSAEVTLISNTTSVRAAVDPAIADAQQAVLQAQQVVDAAIATANGAIDAAMVACDFSGGSPTVEQVQACLDALTAVSTAQAEVQDAQNALVDASNTLDTLLQQQADATSTAPTIPSTTPDAAGNAPTGSSGSLPSGSGGGSSPSSADLVAYQKAIDAAAAEVAVAEQALAQASIATPIDGTVVAVNLAVGEAVESASSSANVVVQGKGGYEVSTTVSIDRVSDVAVGQRATFVPDDARTALDGKVAYISTVPSSSDTTTTYLVVVGLDDSHAELNNGSTGTVTIVTESATSALAVPTSAVTTNGSRRTIQVVDGDGTRRVAVRVGVVGDTWTEIRSGVAAGREVVIANLSEPLPGSATDSSGSTSGGGFPDGGFPGAGGFPTGARTPQG